MNKRIKYLNNQKINKNDYITYWMQSSHRVDYNHALDHAINLANDLNKKLLVVIFITENYKDANLRHYTFMFEGLKEVKEDLNNKGIKFIITKDEPDLGAIKISEISAAIICDKGYLRHEKKWRINVANSIDIPLIEVETNVIVPVEEVSLKEEYGAYTIRNKIKRLLDLYAKDFSITKVINESVNDNINIIELENIDDLKIDKSVLPSEIYKGGINEARHHLDDFIKNKINQYQDLKNHPELDYMSNMSPYLHFGQISPLEIYLKTKDISDSYIEELIIRRDLAINFVYYNNDYDTYKCLPKWALDTLNDHLVDKREYNYTINELEYGKTHDEYWNKAQNDMVLTGKMHGYMRMYWGKKIIEWTTDYKIAYEIMIYLNNKYNIDGRDPNAYAGIAWCFGKHDRPWREREIFGKIRYMNKAGLEKKFDMKKYIK